MTAEQRYEVVVHFEGGHRGSCCAHGPIHAVRRIRRSFPDLRDRRILAIDVSAHPVSYFGTDQ